MALQTQRYTLVGFSKELDRRSLHFVEPIPANRICKVCSLVPRMTAFLPCLHVVCKTCYEQCQLNDDNFCPLDGNMFREDDVDWRDFPADVLLRRQASADTITFFPASFCIEHSCLFLPCFLASLFRPMFQATLGKMLE
nr:uncharacterized protein LOC126544248 isoform X5 [Dermacentor andersoni]